MIRCLLSFFLLALTAFSVFPGYARAHTLAYGAIETSFAIQGSAISFHTEVPQNFAFGDADAFFRGYFSEHLSISTARGPCALALQAADVTSAMDRSVFDGTVECTSPIATINDLVIRTALFSDYFDSFDHFVTLSIDGKNWELLFTEEKSSYPDGVEAAYLGSRLAYFFAVAGHFLWLGILHIWTGYDHILFLLAAILLLRSLRDILIVVTSFTVAHSITLILAGSSMMTLPGALVEPAIALSIAYVALRNIVALRSATTSQDTGERWITTFCFGLVHGLGFANVLAETRIPEQFLTPALLIFNVGIEVGQLAILAFFVPLLFMIDRHKHARAALTAGSGVTLILAIIWFFQRL